MSPATRVAAPGVRASRPHYERERTPRERAGRRVAPDGCARTQRASTHGYRGQQGDAWSGTEVQEASSAGASPRHQPRERRGVEPTSTRQFISESASERSKAEPYPNRTPAGRDTHMFNHTARDQRHLPVVRAGRLPTNQATESARDPRRTAELATMSHDADSTMRELLESEGYDADDLTHPKDVDPDDIDDDTVVIAYTVVSNPDPDAPATMYDVVEYEVEAIVASGDVRDYSDGAVSYPDDTPIDHSVHWAYRTGGVPKFQSIGYGDELYGEDDEFDDPQRWERTVGHVRGVSDDFIRFRL